MKIYLIVLGVFSCFACSEEKTIGEIASLTPDYVLPQGKSPADDRIVEFYNKYNSFILYEYTRWDFFYDVNDKCSYKLADPKCVADMLDVLEDIWFRFYPVEFLKKHLPYKILLAEKVEFSAWQGKYSVYAGYGKNSIYLGYCSDELKEMSSETKLEFKNELQRIFWKFLRSISIRIPDEFFEVSSYDSAASKDESSPNYARARGFLFHDENGEWSTRSYNMSKTWMDLETYLLGMVSRTSEEWASDLSYPLVRKKYDILQNFFLKEYNFDIREIGDATY